MPIGLGLHADFMHGPDQSLMFEKKFESLLLFTASLLTPDVPARVKLQTCMTTLHLQSTDPESKHLHNSTTLHYSTTLPKACIC